MGGVRQERKLVSRFDKDGDKRLNDAERQAAREFLAQERRAGNAPGRGPGRFGPMVDAAPPKPGPRVSPAEVKPILDAPLYASNVLRTLFLDFGRAGKSSQTSAPPTRTNVVVVDLAGADWEKELEDFHGTDVEVPATLSVDGRSYPETGVRFRGASSYMMVGTGRKRSLNLSLDYAHEGQNLLGYRTLNLLNSHADATFLRTVLFFEIARHYIPAPKASLARLVINGESWGVYVNVQQFNKDFVKEWFGVTTGARWKAPGSPNGRAGLTYLGEDVAAYRRLYEIKSKDDPKAWAALIRLCKTLNETAPERLEAALAPLLDVDGALKFLALENALINNDGYWVRASDYDLYLDDKGRMHLIPYDANETFSLPGGPGFGGGPGGPGMAGGFAPGRVVALEMLGQGDKNGDRKLTREEFRALAVAWFDKLDRDKSGSLSQEQFIARLPDVLPPPPGLGGPGPADGGPPGAGQRRGGGAFAMRPGPVVATGLFGAADANKDGSLTRSELESSFAEWHARWDSGKSGTLEEEQLREGLNTLLPRAIAGMPGSGPGGRRGARGGQGRGFGGPGVFGVELDPLHAMNDSEKPLISKLLAVPALRERYLAYVRDIAEKWLDWNRLGPVAKRYHALIAEEVRADTRKLSTFEAFQSGLEGQVAAQPGRGPGRAISLKNFADQRRAYLLSYSENKRSAR